MKIGFDGKRFYNNHTGLGSYSRTLFHNLITLYPEQEYLLFVHQKFFNKSPYAYEIYKSKTFVSDAPRHDIWRTKGMSDDIANEGLHIYHGVSGEMPLGLPAQVRRVVTIHDLIFMRHSEWYPYFDRLAYEKKAKYAVQHADVIIAVSEQTKADICELLKVPEEKVQVVYQTWGKAFNHVLRLEYLSYARKKYALPDDPYILFVGAITERKNLQVVCNALLMPENEDVPLVIVGEESAGFEKFEEFVEDNKLKGRVYIYHNIPWYEMPTFYQLARCTVYPSLYEGFGLPVIEAMRCGITAITSNNSSLKEVGAQGAVLVDPTNVEELGHAIHKVMTDQEYYNKLREEAQRFVMNFHPRKVTQQIMDIYQSLV